LVFKQVDSSIWEDVGKTKVSAVLKIKNLKNDTDYVLKTIIYETTGNSDEQIFNFRTLAFKTGDFINSTFYLVILKFHAAQKAPEKPVKKAPEEAPEEEPPESGPAISSWVWIACGTLLGILLLLGGACSCKKCKCCKSDSKNEPSEGKY